MLVKAADGSIVAGALTYTLATKTVTLDPTASLSAATPYILTVSRVRDLAGNVMLPSSNKLYNSNKEVRLALYFLGGKL